MTTETLEMISSRLSEAAADHVATPRVTTLFEREPNVKSINITTKKLGRQRRRRRPSLPKGVRVLVSSILFIYINELRVLKTFPKRNSVISEVWGPSLPETSATNQTDRTVWEDLDLSSTVSCGYHKCFVRSVSNHTEGYIIARPKKDALLHMIDETELAKEMTLSYNAKTFHIPGELPQELLMPKKTMVELNAKVRNPLMVHHGDNDTKHNFFRSPAVPVVVHKMKASPKETLLVHCADNDFTKKQLPTFISNVVDDSLFQANLARDRYMMHLMLMGMPQLGVDLQMLINTSGELFFIDFGGHSWQTKEKLGLIVRPKANEEFCGKSFTMITSALSNSDTARPEKMA